MRRARRAATRGAGVAATDSRPSVKLRDAPEHAFRNRTEARYAAELEVRRRATDGDVERWYYEEWTFKIADDCRYTPDFVVILRDGSVVAVEIKGHLRDDALVKFKAAAKMLPFFHWKMLRARKGGGWDVLYNL